MSPPFWLLSVPLGFVNVMWPRFLSVFLTARAGVELDASNPRQQAEGSEVATKDAGGYITRAYSAHQNGWEAMNLWVAAVLLAYVMQVDEDKLDAVAAVWFISRVIYNVVYISTQDKKLAAIRTPIFMVGFVCSFVLMWSAGQNS